MPFHNNYDPTQDPAMIPYLEEEEELRRKPSRFKENRTMAQYLAATQKGQRRFTNIPGAGKDTFFMPEAPLQAPIGMESRAMYGDPSEETFRRAEGLEAEGRPVDYEDIYTGVRDEFSRRDEGIRNEMGLRQAMMLKHGPPAAPKIPKLDSTIAKMLELGMVEEARALMSRVYGLDPVEKMKMPDPGEMASIEQEGKDKKVREAGLKRARSQVRKKESKRGFNVAGYGGRNLPQIGAWLSRLLESQRRRGFDYDPYGLDADLD